MVYHVLRDSLSETLTKTPFGYFALSLTPGPWPNNSTPTASKASITAFMVSSPLASVAAPFLSIAETVVTLIEAALASSL